MTGYTALRWHIASTRFYAKVIFNTALSYIFMILTKRTQAKKLMDSIISAGAAHAADFTSYSITVTIH